MYVLNIYFLYNTGYLTLGSITAPGVSPFLLAH